MPREGQGEGMERWREGEKKTKKRGFLRTKLGALL
jgi:hypothetical protein